MQNRSPNLNALRVLVHVARYNSFSRAAEELGVTQSAVSKQIALLEEDFGQKLFQRFHKRIEITPFGQKIADIATSAFGRIEEGIKDAHAPAPNQIRLCGDADFVELWLFPRLPKFERQNPDIRISISIEIGLNAPPSAGWDCAIFWGRGEWRNLRFECLLTNSVFPVARPDYFAGLGRTPRLSDIPERHLIHDQTQLWWRAFREAAGETHFEPSAGRIYNRTALCLTAAQRGDGVTIGDEITTQQALEDGTLCNLFEMRLPSPDSYYLAMRDNVRTQDAMDRFAEWLRSEASSHQEFFQKFWQTS